jgi:hypothetical protein
MDHLVAEFSFGNLPHHESEKAMRLFADRVLPTLQHDSAYATPKPVRAAAAGGTRTTNEDIFAPA